MKRKLGGIKAAVNSVTDRLPGGERRRVLRGRPNPGSMSESELARLKGHAEYQAGVAHTPHIGSIGDIGGPGIG